MYDSSKVLLSDNPNAPRIPHEVYTFEKVYLYGNFIGALLYGIIIFLFLRCMSALLDTTNHRRGVNWGLIAHTVAMFSLMTVNASISLAVQSTSYIDNREYPGDLTIPPGPFGYQAGPIYSSPMNVVSNIMFFLNMWLADGLLLYRCYVIYAMNYWAIALPCFMYLASLAMGVLAIAQMTHPDVFFDSSIQFGLVYYPLSLSLTIFLTLMVILRLVLHARNIRNALGARANVNGLYKAIITTLVESYALYTISFIVVMALNYLRDPVSFFFAPIFAGTQVIAPLLVILRVANRRALTCESIASRNLGSLHFKSGGESTDGNGTTPDENLTSLTEANGPDILGEYRPNAENTIDETPL